MILCLNPAAILLANMRTSQEAYLPDADLFEQGIVGSTPWNAMVFFTMWLQLMGFSDFAASSLMAIFACGCAFGAFLGGIIGYHFWHLCKYYTHLEVISKLYPVDGDLAISH